MALAKQALWHPRVETHGRSGQSLRTVRAQQHIRTDSLLRERSRFVKNDDTTVRGFLATKPRSVAKQSTGWPPSDRPR